MNKHKIGYTACYIQDYRSFRRLCSIHVCAAVEWVKSVCPNVNMGCGTLGRDLTVNESFDTDAGEGNGWLNKLFVVVDQNYDRSVAITNWDGKFSIYVSEDE